VIDTLAPNDAPHTSVVRTLLCQALAVDTDVDVDRVWEGVSTFVYRVRYKRETFYLRIWPFANESFESEALILAELQRLGVHVPKVIGWEAFNPLIGRSYLLTAEIPGRPLDPSDSPTTIRNVLIEAGHELQLLNSIAIRGFGWIARLPDDPHPVRGEQPTDRAFLTEYLAADLALLATHVLNRAELAAIQRRVQEHDNWLDIPEASLAHGDFDTTQILHQRGRYSGIIDFSEIRGANRFYDLGHFHLHDGHRLPGRGFHWLIEGYTQGAQLPVDYEQRVMFMGLLLGLRRLARSLRVHPEAITYQQVMADSNRHEISALEASTSRQPEGPDG